MDKRHIDKSIFVRPLKAISPSSEGVVRSEFHGFSFVSKSFGFSRLLTAINSIKTYNHNVISAMKDVRRFVFIKKNE